MDAIEIARALARSQVSSDKVFGAAALEPAGCGDHVPRTAFFPGPILGPSQEEVLRSAHGRLLGGGGFPHVLDLFGTSGSLVPPGLDLSTPSLPAEHLPFGSRPGLEVARALGERPHLPFDDATFDAALLALEVGSLRRPLEVLREVGRVLRPQGLVAVSFGEAHYDGAQTRQWAHAGDREHVMLAEAFIEFSGARFTRPAALTLFQGAQGLEWHEGSQPPEHPSARVHLVLAYREAAAPAHLASPPFPGPPPPPAKTRGDIRFDGAGWPHCPYCDERMGRYAPPVTVFEIDYGVDELYVCFNDACEYYRGSRRCMRSQGHPGFTYRFSLNPENGATGPLLDDLWGGLRSCRID
jgi:SAM-dependent methyltransferase